MDYRADHQRVRWLADLNIWGLHQERGHYVLQGLPHGNYPRTTRTMCCPLNRYVADGIGALLISHGVPNLSMRTPNPGDQNVP